MKISLFTRFDWPHAARRAVERHVDALEDEPLRVALEAQDTLHAIEVRAFVAISSANHSFTLFAFKSPSIRCRPT